jgi:para-nitrobenzyl esterase
MTTQVRTTDGTVEGVWEGEVAVFRGIPFAEAPVGPRRFAAPVPPAKWSGTRNAAAFGPAPPQPSCSTSGDDWLNLSVWTASLERNHLPVLVWISGGGYLNCNAANRHFDGAWMAGTGAVVVSANYRVGFEGFAHIDGAPANRGLLDQLAALRWVQDNVAAFGGDPENVTVIGQSAGAGSIGALLSTPAMTGLFRRIVLQSLPATYFSLDLASDIAAEISAEIDRAPKIDDLADVTPEQLVEATKAVTDRLPQYADRWGATAYTGTPFSPVVDGTIVPQTPWAAVESGAVHGVELLIGHTRDEFSLFASNLGTIEEEDVARVLSTLTPTPDPQRYRAAYPLEPPQELCCTALSDWLFRMPTLHMAETAQANGARVWLYELRWGFGAAGASHGLDTLLLFGTAHIDTGLAEAGSDSAAHAEELSELIRSEHLSFARTGNPGWAHYDPQGRMTRIYDTTSRVVEYPEEQSRQIWLDHQFGVLDLFSTTTPTSPPTSSDHDHES